MSRETDLSAILQHRLVAILRGVSPADVLKVVDALYEGGIRILEVTLNSENAFLQISSIVERNYPGLLTGAGTVLHVQAARRAIDAGARFLISPMLDTALIKFAKTNHVVSIPGAYTPTEIFAAQQHGADIIKVFPASSAAYIKSILAPLDTVKLMPTGGVDLDNIREYHQAGAVAFGIGSALVGKGKVDAPYLRALQQKAAAFVRAIGNTYNQCA